MSPQTKELAYLGKMPVFDLHCDTLDRLALRASSVYSDFAKQNEFEGILPHRMTSLLDNDAHLSLVRMSGYLWCQCFAVFVPDGLSPDVAWNLYQQVSDFFRKQQKAHPYQIAKVREINEIPTILATGKSAGLLTVENASFFSDSLAPLERLERDGVRMVTLTWNGQNAIASGNETHAGFSSFGKEVVRGLENRRIVVDVSHLNDEGFSELLTFARKPFAASHSNARAICDHPRNLTDDQFKAIADRGGIVGMNFCNDFLISEKRDPTPYDIIRHLEHWLELGGENALALGSDYDGCDVPSWLKPADQIHVLYSAIFQAFGDDLARKIFFDNAYDFFIRSMAL